MKTAWRDKHPKDDRLSAGAPAEEEAPFTLSSPPADLERGRRSGHEMGEGEDIILCSNEPPNPDQFFRGAADRWKWSRGALLVWGDELSRVALPRKEEATGPKSERGDSWDLKLKTNREAKDLPIVFQEKRGKKILLMRRTAGKEGNLEFVSTRTEHVLKRGECSRAFGLGIDAKNWRRRKEGRPRRFPEGEEETAPQFRKRRTREKKTKQVFTNSLPLRWSL